MPREHTHSDQANADDDGMFDTSDEAMSDAVMNGQAGGRLKSFVERLERLDEDKKAVMADMKEVFAELKGEGFDAKVVRKVLAYRKQDTAKRQEEEALLDLYLSAIGES